MKRNETSPTYEFNGDIIEPSSGKQKYETIPTVHGWNAFHNGQYISDAAYNNHFVTWSV